MEFTKALLFLSFLMTFTFTKAQDLDALQRDYPRVRAAVQNTQHKLQSVAVQKGLQLPLKKIFLRAYKAEKHFEIWTDTDEGWKLFKAYPICMIPGTFGPKIRQGDHQVPEGWYKIDSINPRSEFHLSLRVNYPNKADLIRSKNEKDPGGDIFIHGDCISVGCLPMQDEAIEEIFWLLVQSLYAYPENEISMLMMPFDLSDAEKFEIFTTEFPQHKEFWDELKAINIYFENSKQLPQIIVDDGGHYIISF